MNRADDRRVRRASAQGKRALWIAIPTAMAALALACGSAERAEFPGGPSDGDAGGGTGPLPTDPGGGGFVDDEDASITDIQGSACATATAEAKRLPVYMLIVLDGSGSMDFAPRSRDAMNNNRNTGNKWLAARGALRAFFDRLATKGDPALGVGLYLFSSSVVKSPTQVDVPVRFVDAAHAAALKARISPPVIPSGGTPLLESLEGQLPILADFAPAPPLVPNGKRVLVMMTDGVPNGGGAAQDRSLVVAEDALAGRNAFAGKPSITTFAVGVGEPTADPSNYDEVFMGELAVAGGAAEPGCLVGWNESSPATAKPCHFQITPGEKSADTLQAEFLAAINAIQDRVSSCEFELATPADAGAIDPQKVNVIYTSGSGEQRGIPKSDTNGWSYDDPNAPKRVRLNGDACTLVKGDPNGSVRIVLGCRTRVN
jgi:hypothetical protein